MVKGVQGKNCQETQCCGLLGYCSSRVLHNVVGMFGNFEGKDICPCFTCVNGNKSTIYGYSIYCLHLYSSTSTTNYYFPHVNQIFTKHT